MRSSIPSPWGRRFCSGRVRHHAPGGWETVARFEKAVADIPNIVHALRLFGDPDYLLRIVCEGLPAYQRLYDEQLATLPGVLRLTSTLVMKEVVAERLVLDQRP